MTAINDGYLFADNCCFQQCFAYDTPPARTVVDVGDIYTYDRTLTCTTDMFYVPFTCPSALQAFYDDPNDLDTLVVPAQPAHVGCCPAVTVVNTLVKTKRNRGGRRFAVSSQKGAVCISVQRVIETCAPNPPVEKFLLTWKQTLDANYIYINHDYEQMTYAYTDTNASCYHIESNYAYGGPFPYVVDWDGAFGTGGSVFTICRQKILTSMPVNPTNYTFADGDIISEPCATPYDVSYCTTCAGDETGTHCFTTGATGPSEPRTGFCTASSTESVLAFSGVGYNQGCFVHTYYYWEDDGIGGANLVCRNYPFSPSSCGTAYVFYYVAPVQFGTGADGLGPVGNGAELGIYSQFVCTPIELNLAAPLSCFVANVCNIGPCGTPHQDTPANFNLVVGTVSGTPPGYFNYQSYWRRITGITRTVSCTGYTQQSYCFPFSGMTITLNPSPFMRDFGEAELYLLGDMV